MSVNDTAIHEDPCHNQKSQSASQIFVLIFIMKMQYAEYVLHRFWCTCLLKNHYLLMS